MKVLLLHQHFNTPLQGGALRSYYLAKALTDSGIKVVVITAHNTRKYEVETVEGIEVHYLPVPYENRYGFYKRGFSFGRFVTGAIRLSGRFRDADVCYAISVPLTVGIAAMWIKRLYKIPFIFEVGDLWPEAPIQMGFIKNLVLKQTLLMQEKRIYKEASCIVALSPAIGDAIAKKSPGKTIHLIPNMADTDFFKPEEKQRTLVEKFNVSGKFVVSYIGAVGYANGLDYYLECARASQRAGLPIQFLLCGQGAMLEGLKQSAQNLGLDNLTFLPFQNREGVREIMNVTDACFICYRPVKILETGSPNKYFDALAAGKLIIINFGGWIREEIEREKCGVYVDPNQPTEFVRLIDMFLNDPISLALYQKKGRELAEKKYSRRELGERVVGVVKQVKG